MCRPSTTSAARRPWWCRTTPRACPRACPGGGGDKACFYDPQVNRTYAELIRHYDTAVLPARPRKPRDKAKVEAAVRIVERWLLGKLRHRRFYSLADVNDAVAELLAGLNERRVLRYVGRTRRQLFEELDQPRLKPLPAEPYVLTEWRVRKVGLDYHVEVEGHFYSVPYRHARTQVEVCFTARAVEVFASGDRIAVHLRGSGDGKHTTLSDHMPSSHRRYGDWTIERILREARAIGLSTEMLCQMVLEERPHPEQGFRTCLGVVRLVRPFGATRVEGDWITAHENLAITGPTGAGKSWLACALGHKACRDNHAVLYVRVPKLFDELALAHGDGSAGRRLKALGAVQLLILDDWGLSPLDDQARHDLLEILEDRYGRRSTLITSQLPVPDWHTVIGQATYADAILDRLVHNAHRLELTGDSMRRTRRTTAA